MTRHLGGAPCPTITGTKNWDYTRLEFIRTSRRTCQRGVDSVLVLIPAGLDEYGYCDDYMLAVGRWLFPEVPGQSEGSGFRTAYDIVCSALDEWIAGLPAL